MKKLPQTLALLGLCTHVIGMAQTVPASTSLGRVEITGSSIKKIQAEGALPIEILTADDLNKRGISSVEQMLSQFSGNASGADQAVSNNNIFGGDTDRLTGGSANANLRGFGPGSTLVLLNGRRVSTYGMSGEEAEAAKRTSSLPENYEAELLRPFMDNLALEVARALQFFFTSTQYNEVDHIVLAGGCAVIAGLEEVVAARTQIETIVANPFVNMLTAPRIRAKNLIADAPSLMVACGLALRRFDQ